MSECRDCEAYVEELCELRARLAEYEAAARTWENEAERRSRRYEKAAIRLAEYEALLRGIRRSFHMTSAWADRIDAALADSASVRPCTCHPDDNPPVPCPRMYALADCRAAADSAPAAEENERG